jgi:hypothetical protein
MFDMRDDLVRETGTIEASRRDIHRRHKIVRTLPKLRKRRFQGVSATVL